MYQVICFYQCLIFGECSHAIATDLTLEEANALAAAKQKDSTDGDIYKVVEQTA